MRLTRLLAAAASAALAAGLIAATAPAQASHLPESNADALEILADYYQGYWWDHTDLTVAVQTVRKAKPRYIAAVHDAIETWDSGGKHPTIGIRIGSNGQPHISLLMSAAKYGNDDGCDETLDMLCRLHRAVEDAMEVARAAHRTH